MFTKKYSLALIEHHIPYMHGKNELSCPFIENHYIVFTRFVPVVLENKYTFLSTWNFTDEDDELLDISYLSLQEIKTRANELYEEYGYDLLSKLDDVQQNLHNVYDMVLYYLRERTSIMEKNCHPTIRNYYNIIRSPRMYELQIGECILLPTQENVFIIKTIWLRIIQRRWKKVYKEKINYYKNLLNPTNLYKYKLSGNKTNNIPTLKGMLYKLSNK